MEVLRLSPSPQVEMRWFRMWTDILDDPKLLLLAPDDRWYFVAMCALKRRGLLDEGDDSVTRDRKISLSLRLDHRERDEMKRRLMEVKLIDEDWQPHGWKNRQFSSDSSVERTRKWRLKKKRHGDVTKTSQQRHGDCPETEQIQRQNNPPTPQGGCADGLDPRAWERWIQYRREIRKPFKPASIPAAQRKLAGFGSDQAAVVEQSIAQGWTGLFPLDKRAVSMRRPSIVT